jgi:hypothetical protein
MDTSKLAFWCAALAWVAGSGVGWAAEPIPADPTGKPNQMMTECMQQADPALTKEDALQACRDKMKQGIKVDKPRKPTPRPSEPSPAKTPPGTT